MYLTIEDLTAQIREQESREKNAKKIAQERYRREQEQERLERTEARKRQRESFAR